MNCLKIALLPSRYTRYMLGWSHRVNFSSVSQHQSRCSFQSKGFPLGEIFRRSEFTFKIYNKNVVGIFSFKLFSTTPRLAKQISTPNSRQSKYTDLILYSLSVLIFMIGMSFLSVPLYKVFCQVTGLGGQAVVGHDLSKVKTMTKVRTRPLKVVFKADVNATMRWKFKPEQTQVTVFPGETALAFYSAENPTDQPIIGISTYNVLPYAAALYFNKIQCFCFEEQRLNPKEKVDMPVFFYIDPDIDTDPELANVDTVFLSYTFFQAKKGLKLPLPGYPQN